jgi:hypothetical protein
MKNYLLQFVIGVGAATALVSCSKDTAMPSYEETQKESYTAAFVAKYGAIPSHETWDFSTYELRLATRGASAIKTEIMEKGVDFGDVSKLKLKETKFAGHPEWDYVTIEGGVEKNAAIFNAIKKALPEQKAHTGKPAVLVAPSSEFYIYPLFSGGNIRYDLKVKVGDTEPVTVFQKDYKNFQTINGMKKANGETVNMRGIKIEAPVGTPIEVYIDNRTRLNDVKMEDVAGTTNGMAVYVDIPDNVIPELDDVELKENAVAKYIGIEDILKSDTKYSEKTDNDYNDIVLAVVGNPDVPQEKIITNDEYVVKTCRAKRYMIEDLGATDDFDFNDVVVDVEENTVITHSVTYENGVLKTDEIVSETPENTKAVIRAMGGTMDFELIVGNTHWTKSAAGFDVKTMYNTQGTIDYDKVLAEFDVEGWNPQSNNVAIKVNGKDGKLFTITFPKAGTAPMIIAVDPTQRWMGERKSVPSTWFYRP